MCQKKKKDTERSEKENNKNKKFPVHIGIMIILSALFAAVVLHRVFTGYGVFSAIIQCYPGKTQMIYDRLSPIFTAEALFEVGKAIGLASVLIVWIYASLDKMESGFYYSELLSSLYPHYNAYVLFHFIFILLGLWQAKVGGRDAAVIALLAVAVDCIPQWKSLKNLVFFTEKRRSLAGEKWSEVISEAEEKKRVDNAREYIYKLADAVSLKPEGNYQQLLRCFVQALFTFSSLHVNMKERLIALENVWDRLLALRTENERDLLIEQVFVMINKEKGSQYDNIEEIKFSVCAAFVLWLCKVHVRQQTKSTENNADYSATMKAVCDDLTLLEQNSVLGASGNEYIYLNLCFTLLVWMHWLNNSISSIDRQLFLLSPKEVSEFDKKESWLEAVVNAHFLNRADEERKKHLELSVMQIKLSSKKSTENDSNAV